MNSNDIQAGDELRDEEGHLVYTVEGVDARKDQVWVHVVYNDGGNGLRLFDPGQDTPVTRP